MPFILRQVPTVSANFADVRQTMVGFGGHDRNVPALSDPQADLFFDQTAGIGLSVLGGGMEPDGTPSSSYANMTKAAARGAKIIARPWTAPKADKDNGTFENGGHLLPGSYFTWATRLAGYQASMQSNAGVDLYALGVQNEPDFSAPYDSMLYTTTEMVDFLNVLGPMVSGLSPRPLIILPETANWDNSQAYATAVLADITARNYLDIGGAHQYSGTPATVATGKPTWQTEMSYFSNFDATMVNALVMAADIHSALTVANVAVWMWWELIQQLGASPDDNQGLIGNAASNSTMTKRFYALGNWSKFVRPGYVRVGTSGSVSGVSLTAFRQPGSGAFVLVAVNANATPTVNTAVGLLGLGRTVTSVTPWVTDATRDLVAQAALPVSSGIFTMALPASSVTSFVGTGT